MELVGPLVYTISGIHLVDVYASGAVLCGELHVT